MDSRKLLARYRALFAEPVYQAFVEDSGYGNYGYWESDTRSGRQACDNLVDRLVARVQGPVGDVLDVACGQGGTTRRLQQRFGEGRVTAINLCPLQLAAARTRAPAARLACMDAAALAFADRCFDVVVCVEAAFHFDTREAFLRAARRILRPGGTLLLADVTTRFTAGRIPRANLLAGPAAYAALLRRVGFASVEVEDVTERTWRRFRRAYGRFVLRRAGARAILRRAPGLLLLYPWRLLRTELAITAYLTAVARV